MYLETLGLPECIIGKKRMREELTKEELEWLSYLMSHDVPLDYLSVSPEELVLLLAEETWS